MNGVTSLDMGLFVGEVVGTCGTLWLAGLAVGSELKFWVRVLVTVGVTLVFLGFFARTCLHCYALFGGDGRAWTWLAALGVLVGFAAYRAAKALRSRV